MNQDLHPEETQPELLPDNQTQFIGEESLWETAGLPVSPETQAEQPAAQTGFLARYRLPLILGGGFLAFLLILLLLIAGMRPRSVVPKTQLETTPSPTANVMPDTEYTRRLNKLKSELDAADPTKNILPFPQVNLKLRLEEKP